MSETFSVPHEYRMIYESKAWNEKYFKLIVLSILIQEIKMMAFFINAETLIVLYICG